jgi:hypothetical protein
MHHNLISASFTVNIMNTPEDNLKTEQTKQCHFILEYMTVLNSVRFKATMGSFNNLLRHLSHQQ